MDIFDSNLIKAMVINAEPQAFVLFPNHEYRGSPRTLGRANDPSSEHLLYLLLLLLLDLWVLAALGDPHWATLSVNLVLDYQGCAPNCRCAEQTSPVTGGTPAVVAAT